MESKNSIKKKTFIIITSLLISFTLLSSVTAFWWNTNLNEKTYVVFANGAEQFYFNDNHFLNAIGETDNKLTGIIIDDLPNPSQGVLKLDDKVISIGEGISINAVDRLSFTPLLLENSTSISFIPIYNDNNISDSVIEVSIDCSLPQNNAPIMYPARNETYSGILIESVLKASDAEKDAVFFKLVNKPEFGTAEISSNELIYTPFENVIGTEILSVVAIDTAGNISKPSTVTIEIIKNKSQIQYVDMINNPSHYSAIKLHELDVFTGNKIGKDYFFNPTEQVSRNEFLALALTALDIDISENQSSVFSDFENIETWAKPYVSAAESSGFVIGYGDPIENRTVFNGQNAITHAEALVILDKIAIGTQVIKSVMLQDEGVIPTWAIGAIANLSSAQIIDDNLAVNFENDYLTREQASMLIYDTIKFIDETQ